jgi:hypothetical protein
VEVFHEEGVDVQLLEEMKLQQVTVVVDPWGENLMWH